MSNPSNLPASDMARARASHAGIVDSTGRPLLFIDTTRVNPDTYEITYGETGFYQGQGNAGGNWFNSNGEFIEFRKNLEDNTLTYFLVASALITAGVSLYGAPVAAGTATSAEIAAAGGSVFNPALDSQIANVAIDAAGGNSLAAYTGFELTATNAALATATATPAWASVAQNAVKATAPSITSTAPAATLGSTVAKVGAGVASLIAGTKATQPRQIKNPWGVNQNNSAGNIAGLPMPLVLAGLALAAFA